MTDDLPTALADVVDAVAATAPRPRDRIDAMLAMCAVVGTGPIAVGARRLAAIAMAEAAADYQPTSYDDAVAVLTLVAGVLDAEALAAADAGLDDTYLALRTLRAAVVDDLSSRGADLAPLITIHRAVALPSLVVSQQLYGDGGRSDEIVKRANPPHPAFVGGDLTLLAR